MLPLQATHAKPGSALFLNQGKDTRISAENRDCAQGPSPGLLRPSYTSQCFKGTSRSTSSYLCFLLGRLLQVGERGPCPCHFDENSYRRLEEQGRKPGFSEVLTLF